MLDNISYKTYADALIQTAKDGSISRGQILDELNKVLKILNDSKDLTNVLEVPTISTNQKKNIIEDIFAKEISLNILNFLKLLAEKNKLSQINDIYNTFKERSDDLDGIKTVNVISAIELESNYKDLITKKLRDKLNKKILCNWEIDDSIIGGLVVKIDDNVIDTSIKNKLKKLMKGSI